MYQFSVHICSYSGPSGIFGTDRKQNTGEGGARGMRTVVLSISSHEQTKKKPKSVDFLYCRVSLLLKDPFSRLFKTIKYSLRRN